MNLSDSYGMTPLHLAISSGHLSLAELLIEHKADVTAVDNRVGNARSSSHHIELTTHNQGQNVLHHLALKTNAAPSAFQKVSASSALPLANLTPWIASTEHTEWGS